jgi:ABC-type multidrug transport system ATPase subunit
VESATRVETDLALGLHLFLPIGNVFRAFLVGFNAFSIMCDGGDYIPAGSIRGYGGPILYLILQTMAFFGLLVWLETPRSGWLAARRQKKAEAAKNTASMELEPMDTSIMEVETGTSRPYKAGDDVERERRRVAVSESTDFLRVMGLTKSFGSKRAVDNVTLGLEAGEVMALLGPNGAGKSTLVNLIRAELNPDSGAVRLCGEDAYTASAQKHLGGKYLTLSVLRNHANKSGCRTVCPQYDALDLLTTREHLMFYAKIKGIANAKQDVDTIMARLGLTPHANKVASKLSGGNKRKLSLAIATIGTPPVLILDEPTSFMDAASKRSFWTLVRQLAPGRSLLLTTHSMEEADALASRAAVLADGRLLAVGSTEALRSRYCREFYVQLLLSSAPASTPTEMRAVTDWVRASVPGARLEREALAGQVSFTIPGLDSDSHGARDPVIELIRLLEKEKEARGIEYYSIGGATLERVFLSVVRENNVKEEDLEAKRPWYRIWR